MNNILPLSVILFLYLFVDDCKNEVRSEGVTRLHLPRSREAARREYDNDSILGFLINNLPCTIWRTNLLIKKIRVNC